jgi:uncharacterized membrane protein
MAETQLTPANGSDPVFDAVLYPHRSLGPRGFLWLMLGLCACSTALGAAFWTMGAWPIPGFLGLDLVIVYVAFRLNYRAGRRYEAICLNHEALHVTRCDPRGRLSHETLQPFWLRVVLEHGPRAGRLLLTSHGRTLEIGDFLPEAEKQALAEALRDALGKVRTAPA